MIANESGADYLISFHRNASPIAGNASGIETLVYADRGVAAQMARDINRELAALGFRDIGVIERPGLAVLRRSRMPAVLIETGFIDNDADNLKFDEEFEEIAAAISNGILETLKNEGQLPDSISSASYPPEISNNTQNERPPSPLSDNTPASKLYRVQVGAFKNRNYAYELNSQLTEEGFPAFILMDGDLCKHVVVIDHHRMAVGHIDNPTLICHEPYASSASELVCELLQFMPKENNITPLEAQALLAGIMLDTRSFALHVGVRTFEAAAWLRSRGAQTADTKLLFNTSKEEYEARAHIVEAAYIYKGCAIALSDELEAGMNVVLPMAANDLLTINGVDASFVAVAKNDGVNISARSMGALNVQVILEPLGGGGHLMMAGAQLQNCTLQDAEHRIREQIDLYRAAQKENTAR